MSHAADPVLDEADPIGQGYLLEVSSPGLERDLTREEHFTLCAGEKVELRLSPRWTDGGALPVSCAAWTGTDASCWKCRRASGGSPARRFPARTSCLTSARDE